MDDQHALSAHHKELGLVGGNVPHNTSMHIPPKKHVRFEVTFEMADVERSHQVMDFAFTTYTLIPGLGRWEGQNECIYVFRIDVACPEDGVDSGLYNMKAKVMDLARQLKSVNNQDCVLLTSHTLDDNMLI